MKIGIIADGLAEVEALHYLFCRLRPTGLALLKPLYADMQPLAPPAQIVKASESRINLLRIRGAEKHIILIDRENNDACPGDVAIRLEREFEKHGHRTVTVVLKNRAFENWLVADPRCLVGNHRRICLSDRLADRIEASGADNVNAVAILNGSIPNGYNKRADAIEICKRIDPHSAAKNSRSFRKFLSVLGGC